MICALHSIKAPRNTIQVSQDLERPLKQCSFDTVLCTMSSLLSAYLEQRLSSNSSVDPDSHSKSESSARRNGSPVHRGKFVNAMRKMYRPLGFHKAYNSHHVCTSRLDLHMVLTNAVVIFAGAMLGFVLACFSYLNVTVMQQEASRQHFSRRIVSLPRGHYRVGKSCTWALAFQLDFWQFGNSFQ